MRISEILHEAKKDKDLKPLKPKHADIKFDDEADLPEPDAEQDKVPHIVMQLRKALDVDGDYPVTFKDGRKFKLKLSDIKDFLNKYGSQKPSDREYMQKIGAENIDGFHKALQVISSDEKPKHKIKGDRYMSHMAGELDGK